MMESKLLTEVEERTSVEIELPEVWAPYLGLLRKAGADILLVDWDGLHELVRAEAEGSPYAAFFYDGILYMSERTSGRNLEAILHELGHVVIWSLMGKPEGFNYGISPKENLITVTKTGGGVQSTAEHDACCIEAALLRAAGEDEAHHLRRHYDIGILTSYDPDDVPDDEDDETAGESWLAWDEWESAIKYGQGLLSELEA